MHHFLKEIKSINNKLTELVTNLNWTEILPLSSRRDELIRQYFELSPLPDDNETISNIMIAVTESSQAITQLIEQEKSKLVSQGLSLKKSHQAISRYKTTQNQAFQTG